MKKGIIMLSVLSLLFTYLLSLPSVVFAEEPFSIRNDIHFGDSSETVKEKEIAMNGEYSNTTELAGLKAYLNFHYNDSGLKEIYYVVIKDYVDATNITPLEFYNTYVVLKQSLTNKYGEALDKNDPKEAVIAAVVLGDYMRENGQQTVNGVHPLTGKAFVYRHVEFDSWLLEYDDYYVKIDLNYIDPGTDKRFTIYLDYSAITKEEYEEALADYGDAFEQYVNNLDRSI